MGNYHAEVLRGERGGNAPDLPGAAELKKKSPGDLLKKEVNVK